MQAVGGAETGGNPCPLNQSERRWRRFPDGFRVVAPTGAVLGERTLWHDHQGEQPFTRDLYAVQIPPGVRTVTIQARDQKYGYGGRSISVQMPARQP